MAATKIHAKKRIKTLSNTVSKLSGDAKEFCNNHSMTGISRNKTMPEIRCKIEAIAIGERLTLITWLKGRLIGRLLFTAGILFAVILLYLLSTLYTNTIYKNTIYKKTILKRRATHEMNKVRKG